MRGSQYATSSRLLPTVTVPRWLSSTRLGRRRISEHELEVIERLDRFERDARRSGGYTPELGPPRRWS
jgi:hypothetical protein